MKKFDLCAFTAIEMIGLAALFTLIWWLMGGADHVAAFQERWLELPPAIQLHPAIHIHNIATGPECGWTNHCFAT